MNASNHVLDRERLSDRAGLPLSVALSAASLDDASALKALVSAVPAIRPAYRY